LKFPNNISQDDIKTCNYLIIGHLVNYISSVQHPTKLLRRNHMTTVTVKPSNHRLI